MTTYADPQAKFQGATSTGPSPSRAFWLVAAMVMMAGEAARVATWPVLAAATAAAAALAATAWFKEGAGFRGAAAGLSLLAAALGVATGRMVHRVVHAGVLELEAATRATAARDDLLESAVAAAGRTATAALQRVGAARPEDAPGLGDLVSGGPVERAITVLGGDTVIAAAGPSRAEPLPSSYPAFVTTTPFARLLVIRARAGGREAQVTLLLDASPALPQAAPSLADGAGGAEGVRWAWDTPIDHDIPFSSVAASIDGVKRMMRAVPPDSATSAAREAARARSMVVAGIVVLAVLVLLTATTPTARAGALLIAPLAVLRSGAAPTPVASLAIEAFIVVVATGLVAMMLWRRVPRRTPATIAIAACLLAAAVPLVRIAARVIFPAVTAPADEVGSPATWFAWEAMLALATTAYFVAAAAWLRGPDDGRAPAYWGASAVVASIVIGAAGVEAWSPTGWATWYPPLWVVPLLLLLPVTSRRSRLVALATSASVLAALAAWTASLDRQMALAGADLDRLGASTDSAAIAGLDSFIPAARAAHATRLDRLYAVWRESALWREGVPTYLALWDSTGHQLDEVPLDSLSIRYDDINSLVRVNGPDPRLVPLAKGAGHHEVLILPLAPDTIATVTVGPRSRLLVPTNFGLLTGWRSPAEPVYSVDVIPASSAAPGAGFYRQHRFVRADRVVTAGEVPRAVRAEIEIPKPEPFAVRAALIVILDLLAATVGWLVLQRLFGAQQSFAAPVFSRSYRRTVATALLAFFIVPAMLFTGWSVVRLRQSAANQREAELAETLRDVAVVGGLAIADSTVPDHGALAVTADTVNAELGVYRRGRLIESSTPMLEELGFLPAVIAPWPRPTTGLGPTVLPNIFSSVPLRLGFEPTARPGTMIVAALPGAQTDFERDQVDLAMLLVLASLTGVGAALGVAGLVARALGQPIDTLRRTALAIGRHEAPPLARDVPAEFVPVFGAITQMENDLRTSEAELQAGRARTAAILATVATGVVGVDAEGVVIHANPRATELLGAPIEVGAPIAGQLPDSWQRVSEGIDRLLGRATRTPESHELQTGERRLGVTLAPLGDGGLVLAITDITEASRAARIVAWGEMARQVAHEIKNPLTPMRLGLQHLRRVRPDGDTDYPRLVHQTAERLLVEIERLDRIARSFARYGAPPDGERAPVEPISLRAVAEEMAALFALTSEEPRIEIVGEGAGPVTARHEELVQVILNLLDNARQADATRVRLVLAVTSLRVEDDGRGIPPTQLRRMFEPAFSTTTSGTGLGLAIVRRLVEGWGATIGVESELGRGAVFTIHFAPFAPDEPQVQ